MFLCNESKTSLAISFFPKERLNFNANSYAKKNYYDVWSKPSVRNLLKDKSSEFFNNLTSPEHKSLINQLPMSLRNKIFASKFMNAMKDSEGGFDLDEAAFNRIRKKGDGIYKEMYEVFYPEISNENKQIKIKKLTEFKDKKIKELPKDIQEDVEKYFQQKDFINLCINVRERKERK